MIKLIKSTFYCEASVKRALVSFIIRSSQLSFGSQCQQFERAFARSQGRRHCILMSSGSTANLALIQALLNLRVLRRNDAVGFSAVTWSTNVMPLLMLGLRPVPIDVELDTLNVSTQKLREYTRRNRIKVLFLTHALGFCDDVSTLVSYCRHHNIALLEDTCESLGTVFRGTRLGNFGFASTFSFFVGHHLSTIEGGAVCTDDDRLATMLRMVRAHGWDRNLEPAEAQKLRKKHHVDELHAQFTFYDLANNFRPTEITGFLGNVQLPYLNTIVKKRRANFETLAQHLYAQHDRYIPMRYNHIDLVSNFAVPLVCRTRQIRNELIRACKDKVEIRPLIGGSIILQPFWRKWAPRSLRHVSCPNATFLHRNGLYFGNNPELTKREIQELIATFTNRLHLKTRV